VFVVDEALSVGDAAFQSRAVARMRELLTAGATLVFVSHDLAAVEALCRRAAFIDLGRLMAEGDARDVLGAYLAAVEERRLTAGTPEPAGSIRLVRATCHGQGGDERYRFESGEAMELRLAFAGAPAAHPHVAIGVCDRNPDYPVIECSMLDDSSTVPARVADEWECRLFLQQLPLRPRTYEIWCEIFAEDGHGRLMSWTRAAMFRIENRARMGKRAVINAALAGAVAVEHSWDVRGQDAMRHEP
jgi:hypothetical protein